MGKPGGKGKAGKGAGKGAKGGKGKAGGKGKGKGKGGKGKGKAGGKKAAAKVIIETHERSDAVFVAKGKDDSLVTRSFCPGETVYGEKKIQVDGPEGTKEKIEYRVWNPFRSTNAEQNGVYVVFSENKFSVIS